MYPYLITISIHMSDSPAPFILVDGSSYLFRAFHGMQQCRILKGKRRMPSMVLSICSRAF